MSEPTPVENVTDETQETPTTTVATVVPSAPDITTQPTGNALRSAILGNKKLKEEPLTVPEWGFTVVVREMSGNQRVDVLQASNDPRTGQRNLKKFYPLLVIATCFDPATGQPVFQPTDIDELNAGSGTALERVCRVAVRLSGLSEDAFTQAKNA